CVGKIKEDYFSKAAAEFEKRLSRFCSINVIQIPDKSIPDNPSEAECRAVLNKEGEQILKKIGKSDIVIAMCIEGKNLSSEEFAVKLSDFQMQSSTIDFVIGGSLGLSDEVKKRADFKLSMSRMTFPHRIARLMLEEQIYRAFKILANETYHK
ncbi:MAG: 23S rRNA (pseudouridine(1915)-N(3))-methyltransferase RlmH, partial [Clostridia bacterium]|nr:23S rRNA (pseudouridine(1915)-N(3))-methyltransferase RlmH [Clostridia bacterium]